MHDLVTVSLCWLAAGSLVWCFLERTGVIRSTFLERVESGRSSSVRNAQIAIVLASLTVIVAWPAFIAVWVNGMRRARR
jgi:hypothetical protein